LEEKLKSQVSENMELKQKITTKEENFGKLNEV
jgi:hypothetical protein